MAHARAHRLLAVGVLLGVPLLASTGCVAVGKGANGEAIIGLKAGLHPDADDVDRVSNAVGAGITAVTGNPVIGQAASWAAAGVLGLLGLGGATAATRASRKAAEERARAERSEGRHAGWEERELAAVRVPLEPVPQPVAG